jgi:putative FmdB family regulatory protein
MPIYEFHCEQCGKDSEVLVRSSDWKGTTCPHCSSTKLEKKLSVFAAATADSNTNLPMPACSGNPNSCGRCGPA